MPKEQTEKGKVERGLIRSSEIESRKKPLCGSIEFKRDTAIRSSKIEDGKRKAKRERQKSQNRP